MKIFYLLLFFSPFFALAQTTATVNITFQNCVQYKIERNAFLRLKKPDNFKITQIDQTHYVLNYMDTRPGSVFVNERPILITPGDNVQVTYRMIVWNDDEFRDTISAVGNNAINYTYSNFVTNGRVTGDFFPDFREDQYQNNPTALYDGLIKGYAFRDAYYGSNLEKYSYSTNFKEFIKRFNNLERVFYLLELETEFANNNRVLLPVFSQKAHDLFYNTYFVPSDTCYTKRMEEMFDYFFWHICHVEFAPVDSKANFDKVLDFAMKYHDPFVKEYFLYFIIVDYNELWKKYKTKDAIAAIQKIKNPAIKESLKNYTY